MRLKACLGMIALGLGGCSHIPAYLMLDVDGSTVEFRKKPPAEANSAESEPEAVEGDEPTR